MVITLAQERRDGVPGDGGRWTRWQELSEVKSTGLGDVLSMGVEGVSRVESRIIPGFLGVLLGGGAAIH